jgi:hypothetical protein
MSNTGRGIEESGQDSPNGDPTLSFADPPDTGNGVAVQVTHCTLKEEAGDSLQSLSSRGGLGFIDPFASKRGLSTVSLDVLTSGEHLNELSLEDLSDLGSGKDRGSSQGSIPDCQGLEGEVKLEDCCGEGRGGGEGDSSPDIREEAGDQNVKKSAVTVDGGEEEGLVTSRQGVCSSEQEKRPVKQEACPNQQEECPHQQEKCPGQQEESEKPPNSPKTVVEGTDSLYRLGGKRGEVRGKERGGSGGKKERE